MVEQRGQRLDVNMLGGFDIKVTVKLPLFTYGGSHLPASETAMAGAVT